MIAEARKRRTVAGMLAVVLASWILVAIIMPAGQKPDLTQRFVNARANTVLIKVGDGLGYGTGVLVSRLEGGHWVTYVWTVAHVVARPENFVDGKPGPSRIFTYDNRTADVEVVDYIQEDAGCDLALLRVKQADWYNGGATFSRRHALSLGEPVFHVGNFLGPMLHHSLSRGCVSFVNRRFRYDQIECPVFPGSSGGGVYSEETGECVGIVDAMTGSPLNGEMTPVRMIRAWAAKRGLEYALP